MQHKWTVFNETYAECQRCGIIRGKSYKGSHKLQRVYFDSEQDKKENYFHTQAGECK